MLLTFKRNCFFSRIDFTEFFVIILSQGSHHSIPEQKIQPIISFEMLVMLVMIYRSIYPFSQPVTAESFWIQFKPEMPIHIIDYRKQKENNEMQIVKRNGK